MKRLLAVFAALAVVAATWMSGCSVSPTEGPTADQATPTRTPLAEEEPMTPQPTQGTPAATLPYEARRVVQMAKEDLARRLGLALEVIQLVSAEAVDWSDTSLGCPQPGMMYAQVITPGYLIVLEAKGQTYEYHSGGEQLLLCGETATGQSRPDPVVTDGHPWMPRDTDIQPTWPRK